MMRLLQFEPNEIQTKYYLLNESSIHEFRFIDNADGVFINIEDVLKIVDIESYSLSDEAKNIDKLKYNYHFSLSGYVNIKNIQMSSFDGYVFPHFIKLCEVLTLLLKDIGDYFYNEEKVSLDILPQSEINKKYKDKEDFNYLYATKHDIEQWLQENNKGIAVYYINDDLTVNIVGDLILEDLEIFNLPILINSVYNFDVSEAKIKNMIGFPKEINGNFSCNLHYTYFDINHFPNKINGKKIIKENIYDIKEAEEMIKKDLGF